MNDDRVSGPQQTGYQESGNLIAAASYQYPAFHPLRPPASHHSGASSTKWLQISADQTRLPAGPSREEK